MLNGHSENSSVSSYKRFSAFYGTPLGDHVSANKATIDDHTKTFEKAVAAFIGECSIAFRIRPDTDSKRFEHIRTFVIKLLLAIGLLPYDNAFAVIAKIVETLCMNPNVSLNETITNFAKVHGATYDAVSRTLEKGIDVYDTELMRRITDFTKSRPMTAKDVISDLAVYVRAKYFDGLRKYERHLG